MTEFTWATVNTKQGPVYSQVSAVLIPAGSAYTSQAYIYKGCAVRLSSPVSTTLSFEQVRNNFLTDYIHIDTATTVKPTVHETGQGLKARTTPPLPRPSFACRFIHHFWTETEAHPSVCAEIWNQPGGATPDWTQLKHHLPELSDRKIPFGTVRLTPWRFQ